MTTRPNRALTKAIRGSKAPAIARAVAVMRLLGKSDSPLGVQAIARELGLVPSTCLHVLRALVAEDFVSCDPDTKLYSLEAGVLTLARQWLRRNPFSELAQPLLDNIAATFNVTGLGVQIVGLEHMIVSAVSRAATDFQFSAEIGSRFPALISATGRCIAAFGEHSEEELELRFRALRWDEPPSFETWKAQVRQTRARGFAIDEGNYISGVTVIAAPVWSARAKLSHALVAIGIGGALKRNGLTELQDTLLSDARALSKQLGGDAR